MKIYPRFLVCVVIAALALAGCSAPKQPKPQQPPPTTAERREAEARRWQALAQDVAKEVQGAVLQRDDLMLLPIYVRPPMDSRFSQAFSPMLESALVSRGLEVSVQQEDALVLDYSVQDNVVLNAGLRYNNRYVMHMSRVAYLGDPGMGTRARDAVWSRYAKRRPVYVP